MKVSPKEEKVQGGGGADFEVFSKFKYIYGMIKFYVTFHPNEAGYFGFKDPFQIIKRKFFIFLCFPIDLCVEASENLSFRF